MSGDVGDRSGGPVLPVLVDTPAHAGLDPALDYQSERPLSPGTLVRVPLGRRVVAGIVWDSGPAGGAGDPAPPPETPDLRPIESTLAPDQPLGPAWRQLVEFAAGYYQRSPGEVALAALPAELRKLDAAGLGNRLARWARRDAREADGAAKPRPAAPSEPALGADQAAAVARIGEVMASPAPGTLLLHGVTGSGKTEVYLRATALALGRGRQALVLVPEINLTPQLIARVRDRFPDRRIVALHSGLTPAERLHQWWRAHTGEADVVLGTRLAVFASLPRLGLVVVDEEHEPSYKQQEGARYSARDLAVWRGRNEKVAVILGSATPSLETWQAARSGRYERLVLAERQGGGDWPRVRLLDLGRLPRPTLGLRASAAASSSAPVLAPPLVEAMQTRIDAGEQCLVFLNRRGYAPVLHCPDCGWKSACPHCSAWRVFHRSDRSLRCHHCGLASAVPRACPDCGNPHIEPLGRGTERVEEQVAALLPGARVARIDADSTRASGALAAQLADVHEGRVDVLVGTQMVAKGHDFQRIGLVAAVSPDSSLFSSDFRAPERLFALLLQAMGRAGRDATQARDPQMWVQTWQPGHPLYAALQQHDYERFADSQLEERRVAGLPPWSHLALLRAEARQAAVARAFLEAAGAAARGLPDADGVTLYAPVPLGIARVADVERLQMLIESPSRPALQALLRAWHPLLRDLARQKPAAGGRLLRWAIDVDPLSI